MRGECGEWDLDEAKFGRFANRVKSEVISLEAHQLIIAFEMDNLLRARN